MQFVLATGWEDGVADLTRYIVHQLARGKKVLWLVSGGSNVAATVEAMGNILPRLTQSLTIMPVDERFGPEGHEDSNFAQLLRAGLRAKKARLVPVLDGQRPFKETLAHYEQISEKAFADSDIIVAQLGIGTDGHIAGILPDSTASHETKALVAGYQDTLYRRLTMTFAALMKVDAAFVFAFSDTKREALLRLRDESASPEEQPAQILKHLPVVHIYNDQIGSD